MIIYIIMVGTDTVAMDTLLATDLTVFGGDGVMILSFTRHGTMAGE